MSFLKKSINWRHLKAGAFTLGLKTKTPLDRETGMKGLATMASNFPELSESRFEKEQNRFVFRSSHRERDEQSMFQLEGFQVLDLICFKESETNRLVG